MIITTEDFFKSINKVNLALFFKSLKGSDYKKPEFLVFSRTMLEKVADFINTNIWCSSDVKRQKVIDNISNVIIERFYPQIDSVLLFKEVQTDCLDFEDLEQIIPIILEEPIMSASQYFDVLEFKISGISIDCSQYDLFNQEVRDFDSITVTDFVAKIYNMNFVTAATFFAVLLDKYFTRLDRSSHLSINVPVAMMNRRNQEIQELSQQKQSLEQSLKQSASFREIALKYDMNKTLFSYCASNMACHIVLNNITNFNKDLKSKVESSNLSAKTANFDNAVAVLNTISNLLVEYFKLRAFIKEEVDLFKSEDSKHMTHAEVLQDKLHSLCMEYVVETLKQTVIFNKPVFLELVAADCKAKKDCDAVINGLLSKIHDVFSDEFELMSVRLILSDDIINQCATLLKAPRASIFNDVFLRAIATSNLAKLETYLESKEITEESANFEAVKIDEDIRCKLESRICELKYNREIAQKHVCSALNITGISTQGDLLIKIKKLTTTLKAQAELKYNSCQLVSENQTQEKIGENKQYLEDYFKKNLDIRDAYNKIKEQIIRMEDLLTSQSLAEFISQFETLGDELRQYKEILQGLGHLLPRITMSISGQAAITSCRPQEVQELSQQKKLLEQSTTFMKIVERSQGLSALYQGVNQMFLQHAASYAACIAILDVMADLTKNLDSKNEQINLTVKNINLSNSLVVVNKISELVVDNFQLLDRLKQQNDVFIDEHGKYMINTKVLEDNFKKLKELFNQPIFRDLVIVECEAKKDGDAVVKGLLLKIESAFSDEFELMSDDITLSNDIYAVSQYAALLKTHRISILNDVFLRASATINLENLKVYLESKDLAEESANFQTVKIDEDIRHNLESRICELDYNREIAQKHVCEVLSITEINTQDELLIKAKKLTAVLKEQMASSYDELISLSNSYKLVNKKLEQQKSIAVECYNLISDYRLLTKKLLTMDDQQTFDLFVDHVESELIKLDDEQKQYLEDYYKKSLDVSESCSKLQEQKIRIGCFVAKWSLQNFVNQCEILANEFSQYKKILQGFKSDLDGVKLLDDVLGRISQVHENIISSKWRFSYNEPLIKLLQTVKRSKIFEPWTDKVLEIYDKEQSIEKVASQISIQVIEKHAAKLILQKSFFLSIDLDNLPLEDADNILRLLKINVFIDVKDAEGLRLLNNCLQMGSALYAKYGPAKNKHAVALVEANQQRVILNPFSDYSHKNSACGLFFTGPIMNFSIRLEWYKELETRVSTINLHLANGDLSGVQLQFYMLELTQNIVNKISRSDSSSTFLSNILLPLKQSVAEVANSLVSSSPALVLMARPKLRQTD